MTELHSPLVEVVIPGLPKPLHYAVPHSLELNPGDLLEVEVGKRNNLSSGWAINVFNDKQVLASIYESYRSQGAQNNALTAQLGLFEESAASKNYKLFKPVLSSYRCFPQNLLPLFEWMASYYAAPLAEVLQSAAVKRKVSKRRNKKTEELQNLCETPLSERIGAGPELNQDQKSAVSAITKAVKQNKFKSFALYGVTGSGKTEVYLRVVSEILCSGGNALVIVPEIALTPQLVEQFDNRLNCPIAVLHSQIPATQRWRYWEGILNGRYQIALGARSAIFAPFPSLSCIIVDEEHEDSYKQSEGVRYHARDVAIMRARNSSCPIVLGSATPSFETLFNVQQKKHQLLEMPRRVTKRPLPRIEIVDLRRFSPQKMPAANISPPLDEALREVLNKKEQAVILYNRRGFASFLQCQTCGTVIECKECSIPMTYHKGRKKLICHYCNSAITKPERCPTCRNQETSTAEPSDQALPPASYGALIHRGTGTERVIDDLSKLYPEARVLRMDRDTVMRQGAYSEILGAMRRGEADILVGTQMIAKGHDLPGVTLVGVANADVGLHIPDFRSSERTYQLITQAAGRAGRGTLAGKVIVQTYEPDHPTIVAISGGRFRAFARYELDFRKRLNYPPYNKLLRVILAGSDRRLLEHYVEASTEEISRLIQELCNNFQAKEEFSVKLLGPSLAPVERLRGRFRFHMLVKSPSAKLLSELASGLRLWHSQHRPNQNLRLICDIDPVELL